VVPSVTSEPRLDAEAMLEVRDLPWRVAEEPSPSVAKGLVIRTVPAAGEVVGPGDTVLVVVSQGPERIEIPDVAGLTEASATARLQQIGLFAATRYEEANHSEGTVVETQPDSGETIALGGIVTLIVAQDPADPEGETTASEPATTTDATTSTIAPTTTGAHRETLATGLKCLDLVNRDYAFPASVGYWLRESAPDRMDADLNGIPCETRYSNTEISEFLSPAEGLPHGRFCRDLDSDGLSFRAAVAYWLLEGAPDRMDADLNGIPCETVYTSSEIEAFLDIER
jgi:hypothetical protein